MMLTRPALVAAVLSLWLGKNLMGEQRTLAAPAPTVAMPSLCPVTSSISDKIFSLRLFAQSTTQDNIFVDLNPLGDRYIDRRNIKIVDKDGRSLDDISSLSFDKTTQSIVVEGLAGEVNKIAISQLKEITIKSLLNQVQQQVQQRCYTEIEMVVGKTKTIKIPAPEFQIQSNKLILKNLDKTPYSKGSCYTAFKDISPGSGATLEASSISFNSENDCFNLVVQDVAYQERQICIEDGTGPSDKPLQ
jgi:hypothetical protein